MKMRLLTQIPGMTLAVMLTLVVAQGLVFGPEAHAAGGRVRRHLAPRVDPRDCATGHPLPIPGNPFPSLHTYLRAGTTRAAGYGSLPWNEHVQSSNREILLTVMTEDLKGIADIEAIAALDGVDLISLGPTDLSTALGITDPKDPRLRQTVEELVAKVNRIGKAKVYLPVYHAAFYLTPQELVQMGVSYTSVAPPPPTIVLNALRESAQRIREQAQQKVGA